MLNLMKYNKWKRMISKRSDKNLENVKPIILASYLHSEFLEFTFFFILLYIKVMA